LNNLLSIVLGVSLLLTPLKNSKIVYNYDSVSKTEIHQIVLDNFLFCSSQKYSNNLYKINVYCQPNLILNNKTLEYSMIMNYEPSKDEIKKDFCDRYFKDGYKYSFYATNSNNCKVTEIEICKETN